MGFGFSVQSSLACTMETQIQGPIGLGSFEILKKTLRLAKKKNCSSVLLLIDTPGGALNFTRKMVQKILNAPVPVLCLVYPSGAHAASAGVILLQACHLNGAMKTTNLGAATPILGTGKDLSKDLRKKVINDMVSWLEGIARRQKRNPKFAKETVTKAKSVSAKEAYRLKAIDHLASSKDDFLKFAQGRKVILTEDRFVKIKVGELQEVPIGLREKGLSFISEPQLSYLLFMGSLFLLYFEITHPGLIIPGLFGGIGLLVSLISFNMLEVVWGSVALLLLGLILFLVEVFTPSFGVLGLGGVVSFFLGSLFLFDVEKTGLQLPLSLVMTVSGIFALLSLVVAYLAWSTRKRKNQVKSIPQITGYTGVVMDVGLRGKRGQLEVLGEIWSFSSKEVVKKGDEVKVVKVKGLKAFVEFPKNS